MMNVYEQRYVAYVRDRTEEALSRPRTSGSERGWKPLGRDQLDRRSGKTWSLFIIESIKDYWRWSLEARNLSYIVVNKTSLCKSTRAAGLVVQ